MNTADSDDGFQRKIVRSVGWVVAERWGSRLLTLVVFAFLARMIDPSAFGLIALASSVIAILQVVVESGFAKALIQVRELGPKDASTAFWTSMVLAIVLYSGLFLSAPLLAAMLGSPELALVLRILGVSLPIAALSQTPAALLERDFQFRILSVRQLVAASAGFIVAIPVAILGGGVWALVAQIVATSTVGVIVLWSTTSWRPRFEFSVASLRTLWPTGIGIMGTELLDAVQGNIDKLIIGLFFPAEVLGYYYLAQRVGLVLIELVTTVIARVSLTTFSRLQHDPERLNRAFRQMTFYAGAVGILPFTLVAVFAPQLIPAVFGDGWHQSIWMLWMLAPGWALGAVMYFDRTVLLATGNPRSAFWLAMLQNAVGIGLVFALLPFGIVGVLISRWARVFVWPVRLWVLKRKIDLDLGRYLMQIARCVGAALPLVLVVGLLQQTPWADGDWAVLTFVVPVGFVCATIYLGMLWFVAGEENRAEVRPYLAVMWRRLRRPRPGA